jgi:hypothetical protein
VFLGSQSTEHDDATANKTHLLHPIKRTLLRRLPQIRLTIKLTSSWLQPQQLLTNAARQHHVSNECQKVFCSPNPLNIPFALNGPAAQNIKANIANEWIQRLLLNVNAYNFEQQISKWQKHAIFNSTVICQRHLPSKAAWVPWEEVGGATMPMQMRHYK